MAPRGDVHYIVKLVHHIKDYLLEKLEPNIQIIRAETMRVGSVERAPSVYAIHNSLSFVVSYFAIREFILRCHNPHRHL